MAAPILKGVTDNLVEAAKQLAAREAAELVMKYLLSKSAFWGLAFVNPIAGFIVGQVLWIAATKTEAGIFMLHIDAVTDEQGEQYEEAQRRKEAATTKEERERLEKVTVDMARNLLKFTR